MRVLLLRPVNHLRSTLLTWGKGLFEVLGRQMGIQKPADEIESIESTDEYQRAKKWQKEFNPVPTPLDPQKPSEKHHFSWVIQLAEKQFQFAEKKAVELDNKASAVVGYLGSGTGLFTLGSLAAVTSNTASPIVVAAAFPSIIFAVIAIYFALRCRASAAFAYPDVKVAVIFVEHFKSEAETFFIGQWEKATVQVEEVARRKARWMDRSQISFLLAVACLTFPLLMGMIVRPAPSPPSKSVQLVKIIP